MKKNIVLMLFVVLLCSCAKINETSSEIVSESGIDESQTNLYTSVQQDTSLTKAFEKFAEKL